MWFKLNEVQEVANLVVHPSQNVFISSGKPHTNFAWSDLLFIGMGSHCCVKRMLIKFDLSLLPPDISIVKCSLKIYANNYRHTKASIVTPYALDSDWNEKTVDWNNQPDINKSIIGKTGEVTSTGWYGWDITDIVKTWILDKNNNYGLMLKSYEHKHKDIKLYYSSENFKYKCCSPVLEIKFKKNNSFILFSRCTKNNHKVYKTSDNLKYSFAQNTSAFSMYTFFAKNIGNNPVSVFVQVSPDKHSTFDEAAIYNIPPGKTEAIVPQRYGAYSRLAFKSSASGGNTKLKVWFQAQV
jgi:hypothetical protein